MRLKDKIKEDLDQALITGRKLEPSVLRMLLAAIVNREKEKRGQIAKIKSELREGELVERSQLSNEETEEVVFTQVKRSREAALEFEKGGRKDLVEKERQEIKILEKYLPEELSEEEIRNLVRPAIEKVGASGPQDLGKVMGEVMPKVKGRVEGSRVAKIVQELLRE